MKPLVTFSLFFILISFCSKGISRELNSFTLTVYAGTFDRENCIVSADISTADENVVWTLSELNGKRKVKISSQTVIENGKTTLFWILTGTTKAGATRTFVAEKSGKKAGKKSLPKNQKKIMEIADNSEALILKKEGKNILQYNYARVNPPAGVDSAYGRSGFIHPAYSPAGNVLTNIQPKDHYHHYGIWNPWTRLRYDSVSYDLWNIGSKQGTVKSRETDAVFHGGIFAGFSAVLDHYIFTPKGKKAIMNEHWKIKAWNIPNVFLWDFESHLHPATELPVLLQKYRYTGFGYRATDEWTKDNCEMYSSEGKTRQEINGTTGRWIYITGNTKTGRSGLLFLGHPENHNAPEPLYIWDEKANGGRGDGFINLNPVRDKDWELLPNKHYLLRYRIVSYEGEMTAAQADQYWNNFAYPPVVEIKSAN